MSKTVRGLLIALGVVVILVVLVGSAFTIVVRGSFPRTRGRLAAPGLQAEVQVLRDTWGVPHITAANMHDLYFAQGYVTAQDRFWQMEFWRRIGAGRLSELFGSATLGTDKYLRTVGFRRAADKDYAAADPETRSILQAYAEGVNAYVLHHPPGQLGLEFTLLKVQGVPFTIEPWVPQDTLTWLKVMAQDLGSNMRRELYTVDLVQKMGLSLTRAFLGDYRYGEMPVIVSDTEMPRALLRPGAVSSLPQTGTPAADATQLAALSGVPTRLVGGFLPGTPLALGGGPGLGSNNWVISGSLTATGKPILANDPHLGIQMPSIWYEIDLACTAADADIGKNAGGPFHVHGFSFAGSPGVIIGHNDRIAWGVTNLFPDVQDLYIERINPENPAQYEVNGKWLPMAVRREEIRVLHQEQPTVVIVRETRHGPIITDEGVFPEYRSFGVMPGRGFTSSLELGALSLRWTALQPNATFSSVIRVDKARNFAEFRDALRSWDIPSQNFVYADVDGNIGYQAPGLVPIRRHGDGTLPVPGWTDDYEWTGFIPFEQMPWSYNPPKGYIVSANNPVTSPSYRGYIGDVNDHGYRAARIKEMIEGAGHKITMSDVEAMQADVVNISARELIPFLKDIKVQDDAARARDALLAWDDRMDAASNGAAVYGYFWQALVEALFRDKVPASLWNNDTALDDNSRLMNTVLALMKEPANPFWDNPTTLDARESRDDILETALERAARAGVKAQGRDMKRWTWGRVHTATFRNQTFGKSGISLVEKIFNRGPVPVGGGMQQVISNDWTPAEPFDVFIISSMRQVIDLSDWSATAVMNATGQSGHAYNRHYDDMVNDWARVTYHPTLWDPSTLQGGRTDRLVLVPSARQP